LDIHLLAQQQWAFARMAQHDTCSRQGNALTA
jgi:hypothetical protein